MSFWVVLPKVGGENAENVLPGGNGGVDEALEGGPSTRLVTAKKMVSPVARAAACVANLTARCEAFF